MLVELIRTIVQKIIQDKILMGLVIVAVLGIFVGGMTMGDEKKDSPKHEEPAQAAEKPAGAAPPATAAAPASTPKLATDFISWWLGSAMDYNASTAQQSHAQAIGWMTPEAAQTFQANLWTPQISEAVTTGKMVAAFQTTGVQAQAVNPDGSIVVAVSGTMVIQSGGQQQPVVQQILASFLVRQDKDGLRVAGLNARTSVAQGSSVY